jgi:hypothetical protein
MGRYEDWVAAGEPWKPARPVDDLARRLRGYGYTVYELGNDAHLHANPPEDHTPYSATGWPTASPRWWVHALDIMPPTTAGLPTVARLGLQLYADKQNGVAPWLKYMNWEPSGPNGPCYHDEWQPAHTRRSSTDRGHIHISIRSDYTTSTAAATYDPVARIKGGTNVALTTADKPIIRDAIREEIAATGGLTSGQNGALTAAYQAAHALIYGELNTVAGGGDPGGHLIWLVQQLSGVNHEVGEIFNAVVTNPVHASDVAQTILATLTPAVIADAVVAALPTDLAAAVVTELSQRLGSATPLA